MKIDTALSHKRRLRTCVRDLISHAQICKLPSDQINQQFLDMKATLPKDAPAWLRSYIDGYYEALREDMLQAHVEFCYPIHGVLYSTNKHTTRPRTERLYKKGLGSYLSKCQGFLYWKESDKRFF